MYQNCGRQREVSNDALFMAPCAYENRTHAASIAFFYEMIALANRAYYGRLMRVCFHWRRHRGLEANRAACAYGRRRDASSMGTITVMNPWHIRLWETYRPSLGISTVISSKWRGICGVAGATVAVTAAAAAESSNTCLSGESQPCISKCKLRSRSFSVAAIINSIAALK